ncbi:MAG: NUDIX domain-containing protein [Candidatus Nomurabacteria bacterium]|jgi:isopentenyldiphosphate isomerase|nr:NUDIX domain-containing protein [Candidatus Nomurabacteria bacterium]
MNNDRYVVVDKSDNIIGAKLRGAIGRDDIYRVSSIWVVVPSNGKYKVLIAQRGLDKEINPGKWQPSAAGTVEEDESYEANAVKELGEEVGLTDVKLIPMSDKSHFHDGEHQFFSKRFVAIGDWQESDFVKQDSEVEALKLVDLDELIKDVQKNPEKYLKKFMDSLLYLKQFLEKNHCERSKNGY